MQKIDLCDYFSSNPFYHPQHLEFNYTNFYKLVKHLFYPTTGSFTVLGVLISNAAINLRVKLWNRNVTVKFSAEYGAKIQSVMFPRPIHIFNFLIVMYGCQQKFADAENLEDI